MPKTIPLTLVDPVTKKDWLNFKKEWDSCEKCRIGQIARSKSYSVGQLPCEVLFICEAPGVTEDRVGFPLVGDSGNIFKKFVREVVPEGVTWGAINTVACRPTNRKFGPNRQPAWVERSNCKPRTKWLVDAADARVWIRMGYISRQTMDPNFIDVQFPEYTINTYHPAFWLRNNKEHGLAFAKDVSRTSAYLQQIFG